jgi:hypothetical protein
MLGAAVESAWYAVGSIMASSIPRLAAAITDGTTARVERDVRDNLKTTPGVGDEATDLFAFAQHARQLRNYGAHPTENDTVLRAHLSESGIGLLIQQTHLHLTRLDLAASAWLQHHGMTPSGSQSTI